MKLETSDGVQLTCRYFPVTGKPATPTGPPAAVPIVILLHDLVGSSESVAGLALSLQRRGIAVITPDLRGHGGSTSRLGGMKSTTIESKNLKRPDFEAMVMARGGQLREQAAIRGDVEAVRVWVKEQAASGAFDMSRFIVVGSGLGAAVAAGWAVEDWSWNDNTTGPQGREVCGLVLISPALTTRGFSILPYFSEKELEKKRLRPIALTKEIPIMVIAATGEKDSKTIFDKLKLAREAEWYEKLASTPTPTLSPKNVDNRQPTALFFELATSEQRDALAVLPAGPAGDVAGLIAAFIGTLGADKN